MNKKQVKPISKKENLFPTNIFGKSKDNNERKMVIEKAKQELEEKKNYKPELTILEKIELEELGKELLNEIKNNADNGKIKKIITKLIQYKETKPFSEALIIASEQENVEIMKLLIDNGADINSKDNVSWTSLIRASLKGKNESVKILIDSGADINLPDSEGKTAVFYSIMGKCNDTTELLIHNGANINLQDKEGNNALYYAVSGGVGITKLLLENKAEIDTNKHNLIEYCIKNKISFDIFNELISYGAMITGEHIIISYEEIKKDEVEGKKLLSHLTLLLEKGPNISSKINQLLLNRIGLIAVNHDDEKLLGLVIKRGANLNMRFEITNDSLLMYAVGKGNFNIIKMLVNNVDIDHKNKYGEDCLTKTARIPKLYEISKLLIESGANLQNNKGYSSNWTLLTEATSVNNIQLVKLLLEKNVEINETNYFEQTALQIAKEKNYLEIIKLLEKAGAKE